MSDNMVLDEWWYWQHDVVNDDIDNMTLWMLIFTTWCCEYAPCYGAYSQCCFMADLRFMVFKLCLQQASFDQLLKGVLLTGHCHEIMSQGLSIKLLLFLSQLLSREQNQWCRKLHLYTSFDVDISYLSQGAGLPWSKWTFISCI